MKYEAVIFDLFGTLVKVFSRRDYEDGLAKMASILTIPDEEFSRLWHDTAERRGTGVFSSIEDNLVYICKELRVEVIEDRMREAVAFRLGMIRKYMTVNKGGTEVLSSLKSRGYKTALVSNCSPDAPVSWEYTPLKPLFDVTIFSCLVGLRKPDPRIYQLAVDGLAVEPAKCLYVGDGDDNELFGAARAGLNPVLIRAPNMDSGERIWSGTPLGEWDGPVISSLHEVLEMVK